MNPEDSFNVRYLIPVTGGRVAAIIVPRALGKTDYDLITAWLKLFEEPMLSVAERYAPRTAGKEQGS